MRKCKLMSTSIKTISYTPTQKYNNLNFLFSQQYYSCMEQCTNIADRHVNFPADTMTSTSINEPLEKCYYYPFSILKGVLVVANISGAYYTNNVPRSHINQFYPCKQPSRVITILLCKHRHRRCKDRGIFINLYF